MKENIRLRYIRGWPAGVTPEDTVAGELKTGMYAILPDGDKHQFVHIDGVIASSTKANILYTPIFAKNSTSNVFPITTKFQTVPKSDEHLVKRIATKVVDKKADQSSKTVLAIRSSFAKSQVA